MELKRNEYGFTFVSALLSISVLVIILPFIGLILQSAGQLPSYTEEISIQQFFQFIRDDLSEAASYEVDSETLHLSLHDGSSVTIAKYEDLIRRQVDDKGHEIYVRDIAEVLFEQLSYGLQATIISSEGEEYVKHFAFYP